MADNLAITGGSAGPVATDEISGVHHQRVKIQYGTDGSATDVSATNPLPTTPGGGVAHDAVDSGNPIKIGGKASSSIPSAVASGDRVNAYFDVYGRLQTSEIGIATKTTLLNTTPGVDADARLAITMNGARAFAVYVYNTTALDVRIRIELYYGVASSVVYDETISTGTIRIICPGDGATGADSRFVTCNALAVGGIFGNPAVRYNLTGTPSGALRIDVGVLS